MNLETENEQLRTRLAEMAAEIERLQSVIDEANAKSSIMQKLLAAAVNELKDIEVTDQMASAFNQAICDDAMNDHDIEEVKTGLRAAISHLQPMPKSFYEREIERLVAINDSLLANERRLIERLRTMQSPRITEQEDNLAVLVSQELYSNGGAHESQIDVARRIIGFIASRLPNRVTEQDAREIIIDHHEYISLPVYTLDWYFEKYGRALLDKLNGDKNAQ